MLPEITQLILRAKLAKELTFADLAALVDQPEEATPAAAVTSVNVPFPLL